MADQIVTLPYRSENEKTHQVVTLPMMLEARERRVMRQQEILAQGGTLLSFTMNIAGDVKNTPAIRYAWEYGIRRIKELAGEPAREKYYSEVTGCEAYMVYHTPPETLKEIGVKLEESSLIGRLYDMDVLDSSGMKLSRKNQRTCIVCGGPVSLCARNRAHGLDVIKSRTEKILLDHLSTCLAEKAKESLYREVHVTPKPGLVDEANTGAHQDMTLEDFEKSADALEPFFKEAVQLGYAWSSTDNSVNGSDEDCLQKMFSELVSIGIQAEKAMFAATGGVNTHKGAIYLFLLALAALGRSFKWETDVYEEIKRIAACDKRESKDTHGGYVKKEYGVGGIREEVKEGIPHVRKAISVYHKYGEYGTLAYLMSEVYDSNVLYRTGVTGLRHMQKESLSLMEKFSQNGNKIYNGNLEKYFVRALKLMDEDFISRNISPGGCADLLALTFFMSDL